MATTQSVPALKSDSSADARPQGAAELAAEQALVPTVPPLRAEGSIAPDSPLMRLPVELDVALPVREFRVRDLLAIRPGELIETLWAHGEDMPLAAGAVQLAWSEFEVVDTQLAVRVTRMA